MAVHLHRIGSANDAEDHGYSDAAKLLRRDACQALRALLDEHPSLSELLPELRQELDTGHILGFGWSDLLDRVEARLSQVE